MHVCAYIQRSGSNRVTHLLPVPTPTGSCTSDCQPPARITAVVHRLPDELALDLAELFGVLADSSRVKIIATLMGGEVCVCDIADQLSLRQSTVSHQLRLLRNLRLVTFRKEGRTVYYRLCDDHVANLLRQTLDHLAEDQVSVTAQGS